MKILGCPREYCSAYRAWLNHKTSAFSREKRSRFCNDAPTSNGFLFMQMKVGLICSFWKTGIHNGKIRHIRGSLSAQIRASEKSRFTRFSSLYTNGWIASLSAQPSESG